MHKTFESTKDKTTGILDNLAGNASRVPYVW